MEKCFCAAVVDIHSDIQINDNNYIKYMAYDSRLDHHSEDYVGLEGCYNGMDYNDYLIEKSLQES